MILSTRDRDQWTTVHMAGDAGGFNPAANTSYFWGNWGVFDPSTNYATFQMTSALNCVITEVTITFIVAGTPGTAGQNVNFYIRVNNTTDNSLGSHDFNASYTQTFSDLSIAVNAGQTWAVKFTTPNPWTTPATVTYYSAEIAWKAA